MANEEQDEATSLYISFVMSMVIAQNTMHNGSLGCDDYGGKMLPPINTQKFNTDQRVVIELCHSAAKVLTKSLDEDQKQRLVGESVFVCFFSKSDIADWVFADQDNKAYRGPNKRECFPLIIPERLG